MQWVNYEHNFSLGTCEKMSTSNQKVGETIIGRFLKIYIDWKQFDTEKIAKNDCSWTKLLILPLLSTHFKSGQSEMYSNYSVAPSAKYSIFKYFNSNLTNLSICQTVQKAFGEFSQNYFRPKWNLDQNETHFGLILITYLRLFDFWVSSEILIWYLFYFGSYLALAS